MRAALVAAGLLVLYVALGQNAFHGLDAYHYLAFVDAGELRNAQSVLYQPVAFCFSRLCAQYGLPVYESMRLLSAIAATLGVAAVYGVAKTLGLADRAWLVALGCGLTPAVVHAATVLEVDAVQYCCSCFAWLPFARLLRDNTIGAAVVTGVATAIAAGFHAAGHLLAATLCGLQLTWGWPTRQLRQTTSRAVVLAITHAGAAALLLWLGGAGGQSTMATNTVTVAFHAEVLPSVLVHEWLLPYLPWCGLTLLALSGRRTRAAAVGLAVCQGGYLLVTTLVLGLFAATGPALPHGAREFGSFLLGIVVPAVVLAVQVVPRKVAVAAVAVAAAAAVAQVRLHDWPADPEGYLAGWREVTRGQAVPLLVDDAQEWAWLARREPQVKPLLVRGYLEIEVPAQVARAGIALRPEHYEAQFAVWQPRDAMMPVMLISARAIDRMRASPVPALAAFARDRLFQSCTLQPVDALGFHAFRLLPK
ncbi:MAG: hypothetical protein IPK26_19715 [Planctomycetes bacterium]|nr:hypothetical protein [Planctomycetota bacterium]